MNMIHDFLFAPILKYYPRRDNRNTEVRKVFLVKAVTEIAYAIETISHLIVESLFLI